MLFWLLLTTRLVVSDVYGQLTDADGLLENAIKLSPNDHSVVVTLITFSEAWRPPSGIKIKKEEKKWGGSR